MPNGVFTLAEQPSVTVIIDDRRRFHELQEAPGRKRTRVLRTHAVQSCDGGCVDSMKFPPRCQRNPKARECGEPESCAHIGPSRFL
jgi:hypothetical protein